ncbi:MAG TPA: hypothetical protein VFB51_03235 [Solirubrobacterales bacterium]|nr:hypothetical protein [Solirubrobacterales bacterium]
MDPYGEATRETELDFGQREVVLRADLDRQGAGDCIWTSVRFLMHGPRSPRPGEVVVLVDVEDGTCLGRVVSVAGWEVCVRPDWRTWSGAGSRPAGA